MMYCESCTKLVAAYKHAVGLYTTSASEITTLVSSDGALASAEERPRHTRSLFMRTVGCKTCDELVDVCKRSARDHMNFLLNASGTVGDDAPLASKEAARIARKCKETRDALLAHLRLEHLHVVGGSS